MEGPFLHNALVLVRFLHLSVILASCYLHPYCLSEIFKELELELNVDERRKKRAGDNIIITINALKY